MVKSSLGLQSISCERRDMFIFPAPTSTSNMFSFSVLQKGIYIHPSPIYQHPAPCKQPSPSFSSHFGIPRSPRCSTGRARWGLVFLLPGTSSEVVVVGNDLHLTRET